MRRWATRWMRASKSIVACGPRPPKTPMVFMSRPPGAVSVAGGLPPLQLLAALTAAPVPTARNRRRVNLSTMALMCSPPNGPTRQPGPYEGLHPPGDRRRGPGLLQRMLRWRDRAAVREGRGDIERPDGDDAGGATGQILRIAPAVAQQPGERGQQAEENPLHHPWRPAEP